MASARSGTARMALGKVLTAVLLTLALAPGAALGQAREAGTPPLQPAAALSTAPTLDTKREVVISAFGAGLLVTGYLLPVDLSVVPSGGLDPATVGWARDRNALGHVSADADHAGNWTRNGSLLFPFALALAVATPGERSHEMGTRGVVYAETLLASQGLTLLLKTSLARARPYAYLPEAGRPNDPAYDVTTDRTFRSMPSGHASQAWTGVSMGMTEYLLSRPQATPVERLAVAFVGGGLAGATSALRVEAGQHFPSDVLAGAGIGIASGVVIPLLHRGERPWPSAGDWLEVLGGTLAGTLAGVMLAN